MGKPYDSPKEILVTGVGSTGGNAMKQAKTGRTFCLNNANHEFVQNMGNYRIDKDQRIDEWMGTTPGS